MDWQGTNIIYIRGLRAVDYLTNMSQGMWGYYMYQMSKQLASDMQAAIDAEELAITEYDPPVTVSANPSGVSNLLYGSNLERCIDAEFIIRLTSPIIITNDDPPAETQWLSMQICDWIRGWLTKNIDTYLFWDVYPRDARSAVFSDINIESRSFDIPYSATRGFGISSQVYTPEGLSSVTFTARLTDGEAVFENVCTDVLEISPGLWRTNSDVMKFAPRSGTYGLEIIATYEGGSQSRSVTYTYNEEWGWRVLWYPIPPPT